MMAKLGSGHLTPSSSLIFGIIMDCSVNNI